MNVTEDYVQYFRIGEPSKRYYSIGTPCYGSI